MNSAMIDEQRHAFNIIMDALSTNNDAIFFLYGYGGIEKTFL